MGKHFLHSNKEYCQMIYENTGVWADRAAYVSDNTLYELYYHGKKAKKIEEKLVQLAQLVYDYEGAKLVWNAKEQCVTLLFED